MSSAPSFSVTTPLSLPQPAPAVPTWASLASGATSGLASCMLLQPMDLLKTRMQQEQQRARSTAAEAVRRNHAAIAVVGRTQRLVNLTKQVLREDGWRGLWRGTVPTVARNVPGVAMYFYSVSEVRALLSRSAVPYLSFQNDASSGGGSTSTLARLTVIGNVASGATARVVVGFILSPVTIVKARFESSHFSKQAYPSLGRALVEVYRTGGVRGLFRGFSATALRDAPYAGLYMALYEKSKDTLAKMVGSEDARGSSAVVSASGLLAGTMATLLTHPFDILKTRMQTLPQDAIVYDAASGVQKRVKTPSLLTMMRLIAQTDGMGAYLDGLGLRCARKAASSAIGWTIFEGGRGLWVRRRQDFLERERREQSSATATIV